MSLYEQFIYNLPEVAAPKQKRLPFNDRLKWTLVVLFLYFALGMIPIWGASPTFLAQFEQLQVILGAEFGSLISLGIGPIVTGSIILQLLNGAGIIKFDLTSSEGKKKYQGTQKLMSIIFVIFQSAIYVFMGGIAPPAGVVGAAKLQLELFIILQLFLGGVIVLLMDEVVSKWGFGSGISLFIAAGIGKQIFIQLFSLSDQFGVWFWEAGFQRNLVVGHVWNIIFSALESNPTGLMASLFTIATTLLVFGIAVYTQAMKVEIPLSFGRVRGHGIRWPLQFVYTSVMPIILVTSLFASLQLFVRLIQNYTGALIPLIGGYAIDQVTGQITNTPVGLIAVLNGQNLIDLIIRSGGQWQLIAQGIGYSLVYVLLMVGGAVLFSVFWVQTSGMDAKSLADQMLNSGLQIPGFRKDRRVLERLLQRYIMPLTVMGGIVIGFLASFADLTGSLVRGTGILLTVMIIYKLYEDIAREHMYDMNPMMRKFMGK